MIKRLNKGLTTLFLLVYMMVLPPYLIFQWWILKATNTPFDYEPFLFIQALVLFIIMLYVIIMFCGVRLGVKITKQHFPEFFNRLEDK